MRGHPIAALLGRAALRTVADAVPTTAPPPTRRNLRAAEDRALASRAARGDEHAFRALYERHQPALLSFARQYVGDAAAAEDVVQTTFMTLHRSLRSGARLQHPRAWLYEVTRNAALNALRARRVDDPLSALEAELEAQAELIPDTVERREELREVIADIVALPLEQRAALTLFEVANLTQAEVATALGVETKRVKALVFQARTALVDQRAARSASCRSIRDKLVESRGGTLNQRLIRHHLRRCEPCRLFREDLRDRRRRVALLLPVPLLAHAASASAASASAASSAAVVSTRTRWLAGSSVAAAAAVIVTVAVAPGDPQAPRGVRRALEPGVASAATPAPTASRGQAPATMRKRRRTRATPPRTRVRGRQASARRTAPPARPPLRRVDPRVDPVPLDPGSTPESPRADEPTPAPTPVPQIVDPSPAPAGGEGPAADTPAPAPTPTPATTPTPAPSATPGPSPVPANCGPDENASGQGQANGQGPPGC
jgi:RNA polymerase sigma factor (sigma-70 family)